MILLLELGNSRLKAGYYAENGMVFLGAVTALTSADRNLSEIFSLPSQKIESVFMVSVGNPKIESGLIEQVKQEFGVITNLLTTQPSCCGIECGYPEFKSLGVDRWMGVLGAVSYSGMPVIVVDVGTAITIDVVLDNKHLGGFIVPGLDLMHSSLAKETSNLNCADPKDTSVSFLGQDTKNAIFGGTLFMAVSFVNQVIKNVEFETGRQFNCIGTGGGFTSLFPLLEADFDYVEDLTLIGMTKVLESV